VSPIDSGSRHYAAGSSDIEAWTCPACGTENQGDFTKGCPHCGAGRAQAYHVDQASRATSAPPPRPPVIQPATPLSAAAQQFAEMNPHVGIDQAWLAGYEAGVLAARQALVQHAAREQEAHTVSNQGRAARTIAAALEYFARNVLDNNPEEVDAGEWCSAEEVKELIAHFRPMGGVHA